jgi:probable rRNA maturation factor
MIFIRIAPDLRSVSHQAPFLNLDLLEKAAQAALEHAGAEPKSDLTVLLSDDEHIQTLNRQFREVDSPTDVLAFPSGEKDPDSGARYLGDVIISFPQALKQASDAGHSAQAEMNLLVVHGVLHLLGYDHATITGEARMWAAQKEILSSLES